MLSHSGPGVGVDVDPCSDWNTNLEGSCGTSHVHLVEPVHTSVFIEPVIPPLCKGTDVSLPIFTSPCQPSADDGPVLPFPVHSGMPTLTLGEDGVNADLSSVCPDSSSPTLDTLSPRHGKDLSDVPSHLPSSSTSPLVPPICEEIVFGSLEKAVPIFSQADFPPLIPSASSPSSPTDAPSFSDPSLLKTLNIFSDKSPLTPSVLPLDSIRFDNVTVRRKNKK